MEGDEEGDYADNWAMQVDEIVALHAIYEDNFRVLGGEGISTTCIQELEELGGTPPATPAALTCIATINPQLPNGEITARVGATSKAPEENAEASTSAEGEEGHDPTADGSYEVVLKHLPPISVHISMPPSYPSREPPDVHLAAEYLSPQHLAALHRAMEAAWEEAGPGAPIVFTWLDWLAVDALPSINMDSVLVLEAPEDTPASSDDPESEGPEAVLGTLLRYDAVRAAALFRAGLHTCEICFEEKPGTAFLMLPGCGHAFCGVCLPEMCSLHIADGSIDALRCPAAKCGRPFALSLLQRVLTEEEFKRWDDLVLKRTLDMMEDVVFCPKCSTPTIEQEDHFAQCPKCSHPFCTLCNDHWHSNECMSAEQRVELLKARSASLRQKQGAEVVRQQKELQNEIETIKFLKTASKKCPTCGMGIIKSEGCNKVTCTNCFKHMCYVCGKAISGYDHFRDGGGCVMFDQEEIDRWNNMGFFDEGILDQEEGRRPNGVLERMGFVRGRWMQMGGAAQRPSPCPCCGQMNLKTANNNHMRCWSCSSHYCHVCRQVLVGKGSGAKHFGPSKCKQHSTD